MMRTMLSLVSHLTLASAALAQGKFPPDSFTNLKVLPRTIDQRSLITTMRSFSLALGVRCAYCHVGRDDSPLDSIDFVKDAKRTKKVARVMMHMVMHINGEHLRDVPDRPRPLLEVRCATCHRGVARPRLLDEELTLTLADSGVDAAIRRYRALRERYYGSGSYDFREFVLTDLARGEARAGRTDVAIRLLTLNAEYNPAAAEIPLALGDIYRQRGDTAAALASYQAALARDSTLAVARRWIDELSRRPPH
jgi:hypothetical protein